MQDESIRTGLSLSFCRDPDGAVLASLSIKFPTPAIGVGAVYDFRISAEDWAKAIAGVSAQGAGPERVALVRNFHMHGATPQPPEQMPGWDGNGSPVPAPPLGG